MVNEVCIITTWKFVILTVLVTITQIGVGVTGQNGTKKMAWTKWY